MRGGERDTHIVVSEVNWEGGVADGVGGSFMMVYRW